MEAPAPAAPPARELSRGKLWLFRIVALLLPLVLLGLIEVGLRIGGYGYATGFFKEAIIDGKECLVSNERFTQRFFPPELARWPGNFSFEKKKPEDVIRIFVLGESAAMGDPQPSFGASRYLQVLLEDRYPGTKFEIINTGITAINSHVILPIARECADQRGDIWIIYMGNNEMVGPFGAATVFGARAAPLWTVKLNLAVQELRVGQLFMSWMRKLAGRSENTSWGGMQMFLSNQVPPDDPRRKTVYENFAANLRDIVREGTDSGATVILSTMSVNLKDCPPFASLGNTNLPAADRANFESLFASGVALQKQGQTAGAAAAFEKAAQIDPLFAEAQFRLGDCLMRLTNAAASERFQAACDTDALPFRADSSINAAIRREARDAGSQSVILCDVETELAARSPGGVAGYETFFEHVHFNPDGNYSLALLWAEQVSKLLPAEVARKQTNTWAAQEICERWLGLSPWNREFILQSALSRMGGPPLNSQFNNAARRSVLEHQLAALRRQQSSPGEVQSTRAAFETALRRSPDDFYLHESFANFLEAIGDRKGTVDQYRIMVRLSDSDYYALMQLGRLLAGMQDFPEAEDCLRRAIDLRPYLAETWVELGKALAVQNKNEGALLCFERATQLRPRDASYVGFKAQVLVRMNQRAKAIETYRQALELQPGAVELRLQLAGELVADNKVPEAILQYQNVLRANPRFTLARLNLGVLLVRLNRLEDAANEFQAVLRIDPENKAARDYLSQVQSHMSRKP